VADLTVPELTGATNARVGFAMRHTCSGTCFSFFPKDFRVGRVTVAP
jgi:hypothetical protein